MTAPEAVDVDRVRFVGAIFPGETEPRGDRIALLSLDDVEEAPA